MERLNLNIPEDAREHLRRLAKRANRKEGELARELLVAALEEEARKEFIREVAAAQTPAVRKRQLKIANAMERLGRG